MLPSVMARLTPLRSSPHPAFLFFLGWDTSFGPLFNHPNSWGRKLREYLSTIADDFNLVSRP